MKKTFNVKNITTKLLEDLRTDDKFIRTEDWGSFKIRKNGRMRLSVGDEIIRVTPDKESIIKWIWKSK